MIKAIFWTRCDNWYDMTNNVINVLVVEDSPVVQAFLKYVLGKDPKVKVIGTANDGREAVAFVAETRPDVVLMDVHMPNMDGYEATRRIMETNPVPIVISSAVAGNEEMGETFHSLEAGAVAFVEKPVGPGSPGFDDMVGKLLETVKLMAEVKVVKRWAPGRHAKPSARSPAADPLSCREVVKVVAIGASTGGPSVIQTILKALPAHYPIPILIVQHIAAGFLEGMADWLAKTTRLTVQLASHGQTALPGNVYLAPDGFHLGVMGNLRIVLSEDEPENGLRPAISFLFRSVADTYGKLAVGVLLSGMGRDGADAMKYLKEKEAMTIAQDAASSVVHGMPGEAIRLGAVSHILSPEQISMMMLNLGKC